MWAKYLASALVFSTFLSKVASSVTCTYSEPIPLGTQGNVELQHFVNTEEGTFTMKVTYTGGLSFVGVGLNDNGDGHMTPANSVIGAAGYGVYQYRMTAEAGVVLADSQTLVDGSFDQTNDTSTLIFTQSLDDIADRDLTEESVWIWAIGFDENAFGGHTQQGSVTFALADTCVEEVTVEDCLSEPMALGTQDNVALQQFVDLEAGTFTMKVTYTGGLSFVGVGLNDNGDGHMTPANSVIGAAGYGVYQYRMTAEAGVVLADSQTLVDGSFDQTNDTSTLIFTQSLDDITNRDLTEESVWIWAIGFDENAFGGHTQQGNVTFALTTCAATSTSAPTSAPTTTPDDDSAAAGAYFLFLSLISSVGALFAF